MCIYSEGYFDTSRSVFNKRIINSKHEPSCVCAFNLVVYCEQKSIFDSGQYVNFAQIESMDPDRLNQTIEFSPVFTVEY